MQPLGHMLVAHHSMDNTLSDILRAYPSYVYSGSLGPDWFYNLNGGIGGYSAVSDAMHSYGTSTVYRAMLDTARNMGNDALLGDDAFRCFEAARAFAHGFISHVAADCIYHPYVNRRANNPWTGEKHGTSRHAGVETVIDNLLWSMHGTFDIQVNCAQLDNHNLADYPVRQLFKNGFSLSYSDQNWLLDLVQISSDIDSEDHPINKAFCAVRQWTALTEGLQLARYNVNDVIQHLKGMSFVDVNPNMALNPEYDAWCNVSGNEKLRYSAEQLFKAAVTAAASAIAMGEKYVNGEISSFDYCGIPFLEKDYNIDTGIPSDENNNIKSKSSEERFSVATQLLEGNYIKFMG